MVPKAGLEPAQVSPPPPQDGVSTRFHHFGTDLLLSEDFPPRSTLSSQRIRKTDNGESLNLYYISAFSALSAVKSVFSLTRVKFPAEARLFPLQEMATDLQPAELPFLPVLHLLP